MEAVYKVFIHSGKSVPNKNMIKVSVRNRSKNNNFQKLVPITSRGRRDNEKAKEKKNTNIYRNSIELK